MANLVAEVYPKTACMLPHPSLLHRGIETNLNAILTCDSWKLGMIKHDPVARCLGGRLYDCVCCFTPACAAAAASATVASANGAKAALALAHA